MFRKDPYLKPYENIIRRRLDKIRVTEDRLTGGQSSLSDFASGHEYFGLHFRNNEWVFREWAPNAERISIIGDMTGWYEEQPFFLEKNSTSGVWEIRLPEDKLKHGDLFRLRVHFNGGQGDRIPSYARRVVQDPETLIFNAQVWRPDTPYVWRHADQHDPPETVFIYEAHVGMAQEEAKVGTYREFKDHVLPRIVRAGYDTLQLMAIQEHPYYGSFGYHVSNFFAASSRFGTPEDLKELIDTAKCYGLRVIMDIVHSHAAKNEVEGLSRFDGTLYQYFHEGDRGNHVAWDSRCFDYNKYQVIHFLLSNCRFWLDEYHFDGFRFDGITSMLYLHHGLEKAFTSYDDYFNDKVDEDALTYLALANKVIHEVRKNAVTIAEDISGMPGLAIPVENGGIGFDYRLAMGIPDYWIKLAKERKDEDWPMGHLWHELTNRRADEKTIGYAESHDQALVGDKTLMFRYVDAAMYDHMQKQDDNLVVDRGMALHKLVRLITMATAGGGYQNFMGNEFGHPEWVDFPRQGNNWSYHYARRQWHLVDNADLKYQFLASFDRHMIGMARRFDLLKQPYANHLYEHASDKVIAFERAGLIFVFNFHPTISHNHYRFEIPRGKYRIVLTSDSPDFGGHDRVKESEVHFTRPDTTCEYVRHMISLYLPTRTAIVLRQVKKNKDGTP